MKVQLEEEWKEVIVRKKFIIDLLGTLPSPINYNPDTTSYKNQLEVERTQTDNLLLNSLGNNTVENKQKSPNLNIQENNSASNFLINNSNYNSNNTNNTNQFPFQTKYSFIKKNSETTIINDFLYPNARDSRLNLSISRISLKNGFNETTSSKLRSVYKKQNDSILNITNVNSKDNQFIKFFTNNSLYDNKENKDKAINDLNKTQEKVKNKTLPSAQTSKKLASDVISIYRSRVNENLKESEEKQEAKEIINKHVNNYKTITDKLIKREIIQETDVEKIMRAPANKYAGGSGGAFQGKNMTFHSGMAGNLQSKISISEIDNNSRLLSPTKNFKPKVIEEAIKEQTFDFKPRIDSNKNTRILANAKTSYSKNSSIIMSDADRTQGSLKGTRIKTSGKYLNEQNEENIKNSKDQNVEREGLIINKYKDLIDTVIFN